MAEPTDEMKVKWKKRQHAAEDAAMHFPEMWNRTFQAPTAYMAEAFDAGHQIGVAFRFGASDKRCSARVNYPFTFADLEEMERFVIDWGVRHVPGFEAMNG